MNKIILSIIIMVILVMTFVMLNESDIDQNVENVFEEISRLRELNLNYPLFILRHARIIKIEDQIVTIMKHDLQKEYTFEIPLLRREIYTIDFNESEDLMVITTKEKRILLVNLINKTSLFVENSDIQVLEQNGFQGSKEYLYIKYLRLSDDKVFYGIMNILSSEVSVVTELNSDNYYDIYFQDKLVLKTILKDNVCKVVNLDGHIMTEFESVSAHNHKRRVAHPLLYRLKDDHIFFIDKNNGEFGRFVKYNLKTNESIDLKDIRSEVNSFSFYDDMILFKSLYELKTEFIGQPNENVTRLLLVDNRYITDLHPEFKWATYINSHLNTDRMIHVNLDTGEKSKLFELNHLPITNRSLINIRSGKGPQLQFYLNEGNGVSDKVVINIHGGPFERFSFDQPTEQTRILVNLGFDVIELDYHGSSNLGVSYQTCVDGNLPEKALNNIHDTIVWVKNQYGISSENIALMGTSFGGYLTMLSKLKFGKDFGPALAMMPCSLDDIKQYQGLVKEYDQVFDDLESYDTWALSKNTNMRIGIIYNMLDPALIRPKEWYIRRSDTIEIIDKISTGHEVHLPAFKKGVYYIMKELNE